MEYLDHKSIGEELDYFHFEESSPGNVYWHHKGYILYRNIENYIRDVILKNNYIEVKSPQMVDISLWNKSGHSEKYKENMFIVHNDGKESVIKPMFPL